MSTDTHLSVLPGKLFTVEVLKKVVSENILPRTPLRLVSRFVRREVGLHAVMSDATLSRYAWEMMELGHVLPPLTTRVDDALGDTVILSLGSTAVKISIESEGDLDWCNIVAVGTASDFYPGHPSGAAGTVA